MTLGHNNPPGPIEAAAASQADLAVYLEENPVIQTEDDARLAKTFIDRSKASLEELEIARKKEVAPLNDRLSRINTQYKSVKQPLSRMCEVLKDRLLRYIQREAKARHKVAQEAREAAAKAERLAREAETKEIEAIENAGVGVISDIGAAVVAADIAFGNYAKLERTATIAEREEHVKIAGGFKRAISLRTKERLVLDNWHDALSEMGIGPNVEEAIKSDARAYRKEFGKLPPGVRSVEEQTI
jgi:hypothetical protein